MEPGGLQQEPTLVPGSPDSLRLVILFKATAESVKNALSTSCCLHSLDNRQQITSEALKYQPKADLLALPPTRTHIENVTSLRTPAVFKA